MWDVAHCGTAVEHVVYISCNYAKRSKQEDMDELDMEEFCSNH